MSRRNTRHGKARRRAERDGRLVTEREPKRPGTPGQGPRAAGDQAAPRPVETGPRTWDDHGSALRFDAGGGPIAVDPGEAGRGTDADPGDADLDDFDDLEPDDADLQAVLAEEDLAEADLGDAGDLAGDAGVPEVPNGPGYAEDSQPGQPSAGPGRAGVGVVKIAPDGAGEDEEILVFDDDDDLPAAQVAVA